MRENFMRGSVRGVPGDRHSYRVYFNMQLSEFEERVIEHIHRTKGPGKHAARSALRHLERSWELVDSMPELSCFSAITAEEESATLVFHALQRCGYQGASSLKKRNHDHKTALHPFLLAVGRHFSEMQKMLDPKLEFNKALSPKGNEALRVRVKVYDPQGEEKWAYPLPPLEFTSKLNGDIYNFETELAEIASEKDIDEILKYVKKLSNRRNQVLYASDNGIPHIDGSLTKFLVYRKSVVFSHLMAYLLIYPYPQKQLFVQQCLDAFLKMLKNVKVREQKNITKRCMGKIKLWLKNAKA